MRMREHLLLAVIAFGSVAAGCEDDFEVPEIPPPPENQPTATSPDTSRTAPTFEPPHGGHLCPLEGGRGYVEWDIRMGRLYFLDATCEPLKGVGDAVLHVQSPTGPRRIELADCRDAVYTGYCLSAASDVLGRLETVGVLRFTLDGEACRAPLEFTPPTTQPALLTPSLPADGPPGS